MLYTQLSIYFVAEKKPLSGGQRQKRYMERLRRENPEKYEAMRLKHLEKVKQYQKIKQVSYKALNDNEKEKVRKKSRGLKREERTH